jgi:exosortase D (VPLPA-CTERM-specific)
MSVEALGSPASPGVVWRLSSPIVLAACAAFAMSIWLFWDGLVRMWDWWLELPEYSHAILIPPIAVFLIWQRKDRLERMTFSGSWWGVSLVLLGGFMLFIGELGTVYTLIQYAYFVTLFGLVLALSGTAAFRVVLAPLLILLLSIPLPQFLLANLSTKLQLLSSELGVAFIRLFGISVFLEGNVIDLGGYKLQVAEACNGLRYLFPLMTMGFLIAYLYRGAMWKRVVLFLSSLPLTILMNSFRVGTIGVMVEHWGIGMAEGFLHEFQGWILFMASAALIIGEVAVLNRIGHESAGWRQLFGVEFPAPSPRGALIRRRPVPAPFAGACVVLVILVGIMQWVPRAVEIYPPRSSFEEFPMQFGTWSGRRESLEGIYVDALKLDDYLLADYADSDGPPVNLYMAYYDSQRKGDAVHSPRSCLPGGGWQLREFGQRSLGDIRVDERPLTVNRTVIELADRRQLVYYWFDQRGRAITNEFAVKWFLFWDSLTRRRTDGALIRLITPMPAGSDEQAADRRLTQFLGQIAPALPRYVPN